MTQLIFSNMNLVWWWFFFVFKYSFGSKCGWIGDFNKLLIKDDEQTSSTLSHLDVCDMNLIIIDFSVSSFAVRLLRFSKSDIIFLLCRNEDNLLWERLCVAFYWALLLFLLYTCWLLTPTDANYNAKSINNHNHDHNEHSEWPERRIAESLHLWNRWRNGDAKQTQIH